MDQMLGRIEDFSPRTGLKPLLQINVALISKYDYAIDLLSVSSRAQVFFKEIRPQLCQLQSRLPLPARPQTPTARAFCTPDESPQPQPAQPPAQAQQPAKPQTEPPQPAPSPHTSLPPTSAEFVQHVVAGLQTGSFPVTPHVQPAPPNPKPTSPPPQPAEISPSCHSERSEEPAFSSSPAPSPTSTPDKTHPIPPTQSVRPVVPAVHNPPPTASSTPQPVPNLDGRALHFDHNYRLRIDGKPF